MGAFFWMLSFDLVRYHLLVRRLGMAVIALGILLLGVDVMAGMPWLWQALEGPANIVLGSVILWAARNS